MVIAGTGEVVGLVVPESDAVLLHTAGAEPAFAGLAAGRVVRVVDSPAAGVYLRRRLIASVVRHKTHMPWRVDLGDRVSVLSSRNIVLFPSGSVNWNIWPVA